MIIWDGQNERDRTRQRAVECSTSSATNAWRSVSPASSRAIDVIDVLSDLFILRGIPAHIRSDNGPEPNSSHTVLASIPTGNDPP
jgi:hypothetical protein